MAKKHDKDKRPAHAYEEIIIPYGTNIDPYDLDIKLRLHPNADDKNRVENRNGRAVLVCGANKQTEPYYCRAIAGHRTAHPGYGRCRYCGGMSTGPQTEEGKAVSTQNGRKHGIYSSVLNDEERAVYEDLIENKSLALEQEIYMLKAKIIRYLDKWNQIREAGGEGATRVWFKAQGERSYYHAGSADDRVLDRALNTLSRLIEKHNRLVNPEGGAGLLEQINAELRAASHGKVTVAWGGRKPQTREDGEGATNDGQENADPSRD